MTYCETPNIIQPISDKERNHSVISMEPNHSTTGLLMVFDDDDSRQIYNYNNSIGINNNRAVVQSLRRRLTLRQSIRLKLIDWYSCIFGNNNRINKSIQKKEQYQDQEIELIKGDDSSNQSLDGSDKFNKNNDGTGKENTNGAQKEPQEYINFGEEDQMEIAGYERSTSKTVITWAFIILSAGLLRLVFHWWPRLMIFATHNKTSTKNAEKILVTEHYQQKYKRYHVKAVFTLSADLFSAEHLFSTFGFTKTKKDKLDESYNIWNEKLQEQLACFESPKLAIPHPNGTLKETEAIRVFNCKKLRYIWNDELQIFEKLDGINSASAHDLHMHQGLSLFEQCQRRLIYGNNEIKVEVQSIVKLLFLEVLNPFYVFQIFSVSLWLSDNYIYFSIAIIIMSIFGITSTIIQTRQNQKKLRTTVESSDVTTVCRGNNTFESIPSEFLVPGDVIVIPAQGCTMLCDAALLSGSCVVDESLLTGESVPVAKTPLPNRSEIIYNAKDCARHTLFCGTKVMQSRYYGQNEVLAVVLRSGFLTAKGSLVRSIMYPPPVDYKFEKDSYKFVAVLGLLAGLGFINSVFVKISQGQSIRNIIVKSLDLITIIVPPALPAAMTVGRFYAQRRLQGLGIYCISPRAINVSGSIDCVCFDKTGTLTEGGLDMWGAVPMNHSHTNSTETNVDENSDKDIAAEPVKSNCFDQVFRDINHLSHKELLIGMATCHSLARIDGEIVGDPMDQKIFLSTGWELDDPSMDDVDKFGMHVPSVVRPKSIDNNVDNIENIQGDLQNNNMVIGIIRQFPFASALQRMSVIVKSRDADDFEFYCKGSPEMIRELVKPETVPANFDTVLEKYTQQGYRVIAVAHKVIPQLSFAKIQRVLREEIETELNFLGLVILENRLKPESAEVIKVLKKASIRTIMVTGDNMLTAISVAKECKMIGTSEKVIVVNAEVDSKDEIPNLVYYYANKPNTFDAGDGSSTPEDSTCLTPNGSILDKDLIINSQQIESPLNNYHLAMTGHVFHIIKTYYPELMSKIVVRGTVFARMSPEQKQQLIEHLQEIGYFVGMCGDGSNDCGALKAAHAGISLSDTESSVAAPFTSKEPNIKCVPRLIREGRAALVTSFGIFKYMAIYSLIQFISVNILYTISSNLADMQFLFIDLFLISVFAFFFGRTMPYSGPLVKQTPSASLVSTPPIASILLHLTFIIGTQVGTFFYVKQQSWFTPYVPIEDEYSSYENYSLFIVSSFQYIFMAVVFSQGAPYRQSLVTNRGFCASLLILTTVVMYMVIGPHKFLTDILELEPPPDIYFRLSLVGIAICNLIIAFIIEFGIVNYLLTKRIINFDFLKKRHSRLGRNVDEKKLYTQIEYDLSQRVDWPPLTSYTNSPSMSSTKFTHANEIKIIPDNGLNVFNSGEIFQIGPNNGSTITGHKRSISIPPIISPPLSTSPTSPFRPRTRHSSHLYRHLSNNSIVPLNGFADDEKNYIQNQLNLAKT